MNIEQGDWGTFLGSIIFFFSIWNSLVIFLFGFVYGLLIFFFPRLRHYAVKIILIASLLFNLITSFLFFLDSCGRNISCLQFVGLAGLVSAMLSTVFGLLGVGVMLCIQNIARKMPEL